MQKSTADDAWMDIHEHDPRVRDHGDTFTIEHMRACAYTTHKEDSGYSLVWDEATYTKQALSRVLFLDNPYGSFQSHCMLIFVFNDGSHFVISPEVRKKSLLDFQVWHVLVRTFPLFFTVSRARDLVYLRTNVRKTPTYVYELSLTDTERHDLLAATLARIETVAKENPPYVLLRTDCISILRGIFSAAHIPIHRPWWDWSPTRVLWRERRIAGTFTSLAEVYTASRVTERLQAYTQGEEYDTALISLTKH